MGAAELELCVVGVLRMFFLLHSIYVLIVCWIVSPAIILRALLTNAFDLINEGFDA